VITLEIHLKSPWVNSPHMDVDMFSTTNSCCALSDRLPILDDSLPSSISFRRIYGPSECLIIVLFSEDDLKLHRDFSAHAETFEVVATLSFR